MLRLHTGVPISASIDAGLWPHSHRASMTMIVPSSVCPCTVRLLLRLSTHSKVIGIGLSSMLAAVGDAGLWSIYAGLWSMSRSGSTDGFSIPASVDDVVDAVLWSRYVVAVMMPWVCLMMLLLRFQLLVPCG